MTSRTKWTNDHYQTVRQLIGAASNAEIASAEWLLSEARRVSLPVDAGYASLSFAINNACRNTPLWDRARTAQRSLTRAKDALRAKERDEARAKLPPAAVRAAPAPVAPTLSTEKPTFSAALPRAPHGYSRIGAWATKMGIRRINMDLAPDYVERVYVRGNGPTPQTWVSDAGMLRWQREREADPTRAKMIEMGKRSNNKAAAGPAALTRSDLGRMGGLASGASRRAAKAASTPTAAPVAPVSAQPTSTVNGKASAVHNTIAAMLRAGSIDAATAVQMIAATIGKD